MPRRLGRNSKRTFYIGRRTREKTMVVETVAECKCNKEAIKLIESFSKRDPAAFYYVQKAPCKAWLDLNND